MTADEIIEVFLRGHQYSRNGGSRQEIEDYKEIYFQALDSYRKLAPSQQRVIDATVSKGIKNDS